MLSLHSKLKVGVVFAQVGVALTVFLIVMELVSFPTIIIIIIIISGLQAAGSMDPLSHTTRTLLFSSSSASSK